jgi:hypothetical protein
MVMLPLMKILMVLMVWDFSLNVGFCAKSSMKIGTALQALQFLKSLDGSLVKQIQLRGLC